MVELWRGDRLESVHQGHAVVMRADGEIVESWGRPDVVIYPRSSCKMVQALPLVESGAAKGLAASQLALACASHQASAAHVQMVTRWLADLGLSDDGLRCGAAPPGDQAERDRLICTHAEPCQSHHECSGKHAGFLTLNRHLGGGSEYVDPDHPRATLGARGLRRGDGPDLSGLRDRWLLRAEFRHRTARAGAGYGALCNRQGYRRRQPQSCHGPVARCDDGPSRYGGGPRQGLHQPDARCQWARGGSRPVRKRFSWPCCPKQGLGIALKIADGGIRASEAAMTGLLQRYGAIDPADPVVAQYLGPLRNRRNLVVGDTRLAAGFA